MRGFLTFIAICGAALSALIALIVWDESRPSTIAARKAAAAQAAADAKPHPIRDSGDGCTVYAFKAGDWHYFTRCGARETVTTERNWTTQERQGKQVRDVHHSETIVTEAAQ